MRYKWTGRLAVWVISLLLVFPVNATVVEADTVMANSGVKLYAEKTDNSEGPFADDPAETTPLQMNDPFAIGKEAESTTERMYMVSMRAGGMFVLISASTLLLLNRKREYR